MKHDDTSIHPENRHPGDPCLREDLPHLRIPLHPRAPSRHLLKAPLAV